MLVVDYKKNDKILLIMNYDYKIDNTIPFYNNANNFNKFINYFMKIKYVKDGTEYYNNINNVTPDNLVNVFALETTNDIVDADNIYLSIIVRNKEYLVLIK